MLTSFDTVASENLGDFAALCDCDWRELEARGFHCAPPFLAAAHWRCQANALTCAAELFSGLPSVWAEGP